MRFPQASQPYPDSAEAYYTAACEGAITDILAAPEGDRNNSLNKYTFSLAQLLNFGVETEDELAEHMIDLGVEIGLTEHEARATVRSAIQAGKDEPRGPNDLMNGGTIRDRARLGASPAFGRPSLRRVETERPVTEDKQKRIAQAMAIWERATGDLPTVPSNYLTSRGLIPRDPPPGLKWSADQHALVFKIGDNAIQRIFLDETGAKTGKKSLGVMGDGVWLLPCEGEPAATYVADGPEDAMTARQCMKDADAMAVCGDGRLDKAALHARTGTMVLVRDGKTSEDSVAKFTRACAAAGKRPMVVPAPEGYDDINALLQAENVDKVRAHLRRVQPPKTRFEILSYDEMQLLPEPHWLIQDLIPANATSLIFGPSNSFKSFLAVDIACSVATGQTWQDSYDVEQGRVLYIATEGANAVGKQRVKGWMDHQMVTAADRSNICLMRQEIYISDPGDVADLIGDLQITGGGGSLDRYRRFDRYDGRLGK